MRRALSSVLDVLGLEVRAVGEIAADARSHWAQRLPDTVGGVWVTTTRVPAWLRLGRDDDPTDLRRGEVALIRTGAPVVVATGLRATDPPGDPEQSDAFRFLGVRPSSGVLHGTFSLGTAAPVGGDLVNEVLALPSVHVAKQWQAHRSVTEPTAELLASTLLTGNTIAADALARTVVTAALATWTPPWLADGGIRAAIEQILESVRPPLLEELPRPAQTSSRTLHRRFVATTGLTPDGFARWWLTVRARTMLAAGRSTDEVAEALGYRDRHTLQRFLRRQTGAPRTEVPRGQGYRDLFLS